MFDRTVIQTGSDTYIPYEKSVKVERAPTDKSVELLNEMQAAAKKNLIKHIVLKNNSLSGSVSIFKNGACRNTTVLYRYILNGKEYVIEKIIDRIAEDIDKRKMLENLFENMSKQILINFKQAFFKASINKED